MKKRKIKIDEDEENLVPGASNILKKLNVKEITPTKDKTKMSLKERLAMRAKQGNIEEYINRLNENIENEKEKNSENKKEINIDKTLEDIDILLGKKTNNKKITSTNKKNNNKKNKSSKKKINIIDDDDEEY